MSVKVRGSVVGEVGGTTMGGGGGGAGGRRVRGRKNSHLWEEKTGGNMKYEKKR